MNARTPSPAPLSVPYGIDRLDAGRPTIEYAGERVLAADVLALLSGVNFGSVEKVLAAIHAIHEYAGTPHAELVQLEDVPLVRVNVRDVSDAERARRARELCEDIAECKTLYGYAEVDALLYLTDRFVNGSAGY